MGVPADPGDLLRRAGLAPQLADACDRDVDVVDPEIGQEAVLARSGMDAPPASEAMW